MAGQHHLGFPLLSDAENKLARQFKLAYRVPDYQQEIYSRVFINLPFVNGDSSWELPIPATYIIGNDSQTENHRGHRGSQREEPRSNNSILYSFADPDYTNRPEPADLLRFLAQLSS